MLKLLFLVVSVLLLIVITYHYYLIVITDHVFIAESDVELFEDNPFQYIRADVEGSDAETRRRSASDFVRALCKVKEQSVSTIFSNYLGNLIGVSALYCF